MASAVVDAIGATGAVLTTLCWVPQAVKIVRERETVGVTQGGVRYDESMVATLTGLDPSR